MGHSPMDCGKSIMFVAQESHIFHITLRENLLMAKLDASEQELRHVLDVVCLTTLVEQLDQGLDTQLGENGDLLSGGERRRLSMARALLTSPRILLLDEPTAGIDSTTARQMLANLRSCLPESTIVVATYNSWLVAIVQQQIQLTTNDHSFSSHAKSMYPV
ncbi:hypothetical protein KSZ_49690 [Dictyobacter formicarum]|uniref:ABC transporter domain-containing protein n=1 Tax=Dictyobacter formicarum TaxID=2778368 RepID=A0ABQ3VMX9_9CHLR|nr:hypothetical protein KSZ_49690 [Dictyobacter formicarum]